MTSPFGVKTKTSSRKMSILNASMNSSGSCVSSSISKRRETHCSFESMLSLEVSPDLYFQCAAIPNSAMRCISKVRICTSNGMPLLLITLVCSERYMFGFGLEM